MNFTKISLITALLFFGLNTFAQKDKKKEDDKKGHLGILAGWNNASTSTSNFDTKSVSGFYAGAVWEHKIFPSLRFHSGLVYDQNGFKVDNNLLGLEKVRYDYLTVPVIAKVQILRFYALGGMTGGLRLGGKQFFEDGSTEKIDSGDLKTYDFAAQLGLGFEIAFIGIEGRYNWGLTDLNKVDAAESIQNRYFQLGVHVKLP